MTPGKAKGERRKAKVRNEPFRGVVAFLTLLTLIASSCVERVDAPLPIDPQLAAQAGKWSEVGSFGGDATLTVESDDPWQRRYDDGTFVLISGVDSTADEVWACDIGISRIQVFDYDGNFLRSYGSGIPTTGVKFTEGAPVDGTRPTDAELLRLVNESRDASNGFERSPAGQRWIESHRENFIASDVLALPFGYIMADWAKTGIYDQAKRRPGIIQIPFDPATRPVRFEGTEPGWPTYIVGDRDGTHYASSDPLRNALYLWEPARKEGQKYRASNHQVAMADVMSALYRSEGSPLPFLAMLGNANKAGGGPGQFNHIAGVALAFEKVLVCDMENQRIQIIEARGDDEFYFGKVMRVIDGMQTDGKRRFMRPRDIDVNLETGYMYVLDDERQEVVELSPTFDRLGVVAKGFGSAQMLDLSPDGRHLFVTDRHANQVHHYVRSD
jgi:hypothetical protein